MTPPLLCSAQRWSNIIGAARVPSRSLRICPNAKALGIMMHAVGASPSVIASVRGTGLGRRSTIDRITLFLIFAATMDLQHKRPIADFELPGGFSFLFFSSSSSSSSFSFSLSDQVSTEN